MTALQADLVNFTVLTQLAEQYADTIIHECRLTGRHDMLNRVRSVKDKLSWFLLHLRATLPREDAEAFTSALNKIDGMGALNVVEHAMGMNEEGRDKLLEIIKVLKTGQRIKIETFDD